jgi:PAS domain S-box-containing protein
VMFEVVRRVRTLCLPTIFISILLLLQPSSAEPIVIEKTTGRWDIVKDTEYLEDRGKKLTIDDIIGSHDWKSSQGDSFNFGYSPSAYWFRFSIDNRTRNECYLELTYPLLDRIRLYRPDESGILRVVETGDSLPFHEREIIDRNFVFPIKNKPGTQTIYLRIENIASSLNFSMIIWTYKTYLSDRNRELPLLWIFFGLLIAMVIYNLFVFISVRELSHLYIVLFILSLMIFHLYLKGFAFQYLWPNASWWQNHCPTFLATTMTVFCILYVRSFLETEKNFHTSDKLLVFTGILPSLPILLISLLLNQLRGFKAAVWVWIFYLVVVLVLLIIRGVTRGSRPARYLILGLFAYLILILLLIPIKLGLVSPILLPDWGMEIGASMMIILFSLGLADKINVMGEELTTSEEKYQMLVEDLNDIIYQIDTKGVFRYISPAIEQLFGYKQDEMLGRNVGDFVLKEDMARLEENVANAYSSGETEPQEYRILDKSGELKWIRVHGKLVLEDGKFAGLRGIITDITKQKKAEEERLKSESKYHDIIENMYEGYFETDLAGNVTYANKSNYRMRGYSREEYIGSNYKKHFTPEGAKKIFQLYNEVYRTGEPKSLEEYEVIRKDGSILTIEASVALLRDDAGKSTGFRTITRDVTERKRAEEVRLKSESKFHDIIESMEEGYIESDLAGNIIYANQSACRRLGFTQEEYIGSSYRGRTTPEGAKKVFQLYNEVYRTGESKFLEEYDAIRKDGSILTVEASVSLLRDDAGKSTGFRTITRDVTERKKAEEARLKSESKFQDIIENMDEGYLENDLAGNITYANQSACRNLGYPREEYIGSNYKKFYKPENAKKIFQLYNEVYRTGKPKSLAEYEMIRKDGSILTVEASVSLLRDDAGKSTGFRTITRDVTERKKAEEARLKSESKFHDIIENMDEGYLESDLVGNITYANRSASRMMGYPLEEYIGSYYKKFYKPENTKKIFQLYNEVYRTGKHKSMEEYEMIRKDGSILIVEASVALVRDDAGKPTGFRTIMRDVTERKKAEEARLKSESKFHDIIENMDEWYLESNLVGNITYVNRSACRMMGYPVEEYIGINYKKFFTPEGAKKIFQIYNEVYRTGKPKSLEEYEVLTKDGSIVTVQSSVALVRDDTGKPTGFRTIMRDVTERKKAEEARLKSESKFHDIIDNMDEGYTEDDLAGNVTYANKSVYQRLGYTPEEYIGRNYKERFSPETAKRLYKIYNEVYRTGKPNLLEQYEFIRKDGQIRIMELSVALRRDDTGKPIGFRTLMIDVTERKKAEEARLKSESKFHEIIDNMDEGYTEDDLAGNITYANKSACTKMGYSREEYIGKSYKERFSPEVAIKIFQTYNEVYRTGEPKSMEEYEVLTKDGRTLAVEASVALLRDDAGKPTGFRTITRDVTERKMAEEARLKSESKFHDIIDNMDEGYTEVDLTGNAIYVNQSACRNLGYPREEYIGSNYKKFYKPENAKKIFQIYNEIYRTGKPRSMEEYEMIRKDGSILIVEASAALLRDDAGKPTGFQLITRDVTERKRAEMAIQESEKKYRDLVENINDIIFSMGENADINYISPAVEKQYGYTASDLMGSNFLSFIHEDDSESVIEAYNKILTGSSKTERVECRALTRSGEVRWFQTTGTPIHNNERIIGVRGVMSDITERKKAEDELKRYRDHLEELVEERTSELEKAQRELIRRERLSALGQLTATLAHEIRNPLGTVRTNVFSITDALKRNEPDRINRAITLVEKNIIRCDNIITELLDFTRERTLELKRTEIDRWLGEVIEEINIPENIAFHEELVSGAEISIDVNHFRRAVINVMNNAIQALQDEHSRGSQLSVSTGVGDRRLEIRISDTGCGIAADIIDKIFEPLFSTKSFGVGLGLSIVRDIMEEHKGGVEIQSEPGTGTTVLLWVPIN